MYTADELNKITKDTPERKKLKEMEDIHSQLFRDAYEGKFDSLLVAKHYCTSLTLEEVITDLENRGYKITVLEGLLRISWE